MPPDADESTDPTDLTDPPPGTVAARSGLVLTVLGIGVLVLGAFGATNSEVQPECPSDTVQLALFQFDDEGAVLVESASVPSPVSISDVTARSAHWSSTTPISALVIKAGDGSKDVSYEPGASSGDLDAAGLDAAITSARFCVAASEETPPTKPTTSTTEVVPTKPTTTTIVTTTEVATSTTDVESTTTDPPVESVPTTAATVPPESSVTTVVSSTFTSLPPSTPTASVPGSEPPPVQVSNEVVVVTSITPDDDTRTGSSGALAFTGASSTPLLVLGAVLAMVGLTMVMVARERARSV